MSAKSCIRTEEAAERICTYRYEYKGRGFQMKKHVIAAVAAARDRALKHHDEKCPHAASHLTLHRRNGCNTRRVKQRKHKEACRRAPGKHTSEHPA